MRRKIVVFAGCVVLVGFFALVKWAIEQPLDEKAKAPVRPSEYEIASGMSVRYRHLHAESVSFKVARIRRRRMGAFTLGAFRVLELEDVCLNLPLPAEMDAAVPAKELPAKELPAKAMPAAGAKAPAAPALEKGQLDKVLEKMGLSGIGRFSGVTIQGLRVGRMTATGAEPLFAAQQAEARESSLQLFQCVVFQDGNQVQVPKARIEWKDDGLRLVWADGQLDLPELVEVQR